MFLQFNCSFPVFWGASFLGVLLGGSPSRGLFLGGTSFWGLPPSWGVLQFSFWGVSFGRGSPLGGSSWGVSFLGSASFLGGLLPGGLLLRGQGVPPSRGLILGVSLLRGLLAWGSPCLGVSPC